MTRRKATCRWCHRSIWWAEAYGKWLHRKPGDAYREGPRFSGGRHDAEPPDLMADLEASLRRDGGRR